MVANFAYRMADNHHIRFRSLLNTLSFAETMFQEGFFSDLSADIHNYRANYKDQEVSTFQLSGEHYFETGSLGSLLEWRGSTSTAETAQDYRYTLYADFSGDGQLRPDRQLVLRVHVLQRSRGHRRRPRRGLDQVPLRGLELRQRQGRRRLDLDRPRLLRTPLPLQEPRPPGRRPHPGSRGHLRRAEHLPQRLRDRGDHPADRQLHGQPGDPGRVRAARLDPRQVAAGRRRALRGVGHRGRLEGPLQSRARAADHHPRGPGLAAVVERALPPDHRSEPAADRLRDRQPAGVPRALALRLHRRRRLLRPRRQPGAGERLASAPTTPAGSGSRRPPTSSR